jgi:predicted SAM-dependent methyltransferase
LDRTQEILKHITKEQRGIEVAPYHSPLVPRRLGFNSLTLDVFETAELRRRAETDPHIPRDHLEHIEDVDLVGSAVELADLVRSRFGADNFDYVISSHNFEHLPNPIRFLQGCEQILKPGAVLSMAIPDRRYCFDFYRPVTELSEWLAAFHEKRAKPTPTQVFRHEAFAVWQDLTEADSGGQYRDVHCSAFTPASLELMLVDLKHLGLIRFEVMEISEPWGCEFFVHLRNPFGNGQQIDRASFYRRRADVMKRMVIESAWSGSVAGQTSAPLPA